MPAIREPERNSELLDTLFELVDPRPAVSDAYWAATHPVDRVMGRGRASNGQMMFPWGAKFPPKSYVVGPPEKGLTAVRLPQSQNVPLKKGEEDSLTWRGTLMRTGYYQERPRGMPREFWDRENFRKEAEKRTNPLGGAAPVSARSIRNAAREEHGSPVRYNVIDKNGKIVGSSHFYFKPDEVVVGETFLKKEVGGSPTVFKDMMGPAVDHAMKNEIPINATAGNPKVARLLRNMAKKAPGKDRPMISSAYGTPQQRAQEISSMRRLPSYQDHLDRQAAEQMRRENETAAREVANARGIQKSSPEFHQTLEAGRNIQRAMRRRAEQIRDRPAVPWGRPGADLTRRPPPRQIEENPNPLGRKDFATAVDARAAGMAFQRQQRELQARREAAAVLEQKRRAMLAERYRAEQLARMRRAPNPIRISRPGRGGV